jgi:glyoxylase-like metal-dependent hydrolase (beta-lactamase superfamily II)
LCEIGIGLRCSSRVLAQSDGGESMIEEVASNLYRVEIPLLGNPLRSINSYILKGQERNLIIDTGMNQGPCMKAMHAGIKSLTVDLKRTDFFITHVHVDHLGLVANLATDQSTIYLSEADANIFHEVVFGRLWNDIIQYLCLNGFPESKLKEAFPNHPACLYGVKEPLAFRFLRNGDSVGIENYLFRCLETPGHTKGHMCLYEPNLKILVSGDHILNDITPTISLRSQNGNPLKEYLASLNKVDSLEIDLVLPGHRKIFKNCKKRIGELRRHHDERLNEICSILESGDKNAYEVASHMKWDVTFDSWDQFPASQKWFATGEAISHLKYLEDKGMIRRRIQEQRMIFSLDR